jgi:hypothetical protein
LSYLDGLPAKAADETVLPDPPAKCTRSAHNMRPTASQHKPAYIPRDHLRPGRPARTPEPTPVEKRIAEIWQAMQDGRLTRTQAEIWDTVLSAFLPYKNGSHGIRNRHGDVMTEAMIVDAYVARYGRPVSKWTVSISKRPMVECFDWFGWCATPAGSTFQMQPDGTMPMRGKRGKLIRASCDFSHDGRTLTKQKLHQGRKEPKTVYVDRAEPTPPPDPVAVKLARLAALQPTAAHVEFGMRLHLTEREIDADAARMRAWYVDPEHPERRARAPADPAAKLFEWLEHGATRKAIRKVEREAMELRRQAAEAELRAAADERQRHRAHDHCDDSADAWWHLPDDDGEDAWRLRLTGSDDPPPPTRAEIIARMREIAPIIERNGNPVVPP